MSEDAAIELCEMYTGGKVFGIATSAIREVLGVRTVHRVPLAPDFIAGMVAYRGEVLTTVSLRSALGVLDPGAGEESGQAPGQESRQAPGHQSRQGPGRESRQAPERVLGPALEPAPERCVLVLDGGVDWKGEVEHFGLAVEAMGSVVVDPERDVLPTIVAANAAAVIVAAEAADEGWKNDAGRVSLAEDCSGSWLAGEGREGQTPEEHGAVYCGAFRVRGRLLLQLNPGQLRPAYLLKQGTAGGKRGTGCER